MPHLEDDREGEYAKGRQLRRFYVSRRFEREGPDGVPSGEFSRFAYQVLDADSDVVFENDNGWEILLRQTPIRQQLKALFFEDDRRIETLAFQRFDAQGRKINRESFRLQGDEVDQLSAFLTLIRASSLDLAEHDEGVRFLPAAIDSLIGDTQTRAEFVRRYASELAEIVRSDVHAPDVIALARRKAELQRFHSLLTNPDAFHAEREALRSSGRGSGLEAVWQSFFERNRWIFGAGLGAQFLHAWSADRLEQITVGGSAFSRGKRPDGLLRSAGAISGLVFVEIKHHETPLLERKEYRSGTWSPSSEVAGAVAQCHATVDDTMRFADRVLRGEDEAGNPTGEQAIACRPRSIVVVGSLEQFMGDWGPNVAQFESFERFRRSLRDPEVITYDELYERARMVLELEEA